MFLFYYDYYWSCYSCFFNCLLCYISLCNVYLLQVIEVVSWCINNEGVIVEDNDADVILFNDYGGVNDMLLLLIGSCCCCGGSLLLMLILFSLLFSSNKDVLLLLLFPLSIMTNKGSLANSIAITLLMCSLNLPYSLYIVLILTYNFTTT